MEISRRGFVSAVLAPLVRSQVMPAEQIINLALENPDQLLGINWFIPASFIERRVEIIRESPPDSRYYALGDGTYLKNGGNEWAILYSRDVLPSWNSDPQFVRQVFDRNRSAFPVEYLDQVYQQQLQINQRYRCSLRGRCELSETGSILSECERYCQPEDHPDLAYLIYANDIEKVYQLPPSDQVRVLREIVGYDIHPALINEVIKALYEQDWMKMRQMTVLRRYLTESYTPVQIFLRDLAYTLDLNLDAIDFERVETSLIALINNDERWIRFRATPNPETLTPIMPSILRLLIRNPSNNPALGSVQTIIRTNLQLIISLAT